MMGVPSHSINVLKIVPAGKSGVNKLQSEKLVVNNTQLGSSFNLP